MHLNTQKTLPRNELINRAKRKHAIGFVLSINSFELNRNVLELRVSTNNWLLERQEMIHLSNRLTSTSLARLQFLPNSSTNSIDLNSQTADVLFKFVERAMSIGRISLIQNLNTKRYNQV